MEGLPNNGNNRLKQNDIRLFDKRLGEICGLGDISSWTAPSGRLRGTELHWVAESGLGYGIRLPRGLATPFMELDAGHSGRGGARFGVRHEFGERARGLVVEWGIEPSSFANAGNRILLEALGRC